MKTYELGAIVSAYITIPAESADWAVDWMYDNFPSEIEITLKNGETARFNLQVDDVPNCRNVTPAKEQETAEKPQYCKTIPMADFRSKYKRTGNSRDAIFGARKALMEEIYATGNPIYCDQSYYTQEVKLDLMEKVGEHFQCAGYKTFEDWRDCHYYYEYADEQGNIIWLMRGGRYD